MTQERRLQLGQGQRRRRRTLLRPQVITNRVARVGEGRRPVQDSTAALKTTVLLSRANLDAA